MLQYAQRPEVDSKGLLRGRHSLLGHRAWGMQHSLSSSLLFSTRGCFMNTFRDHSNCTKQFSSPCSLCFGTAALPQQWLVLFLKVILQQSGVAFPNLCWHYATDKLNSTREAGRKRTQQLYKGMSKNESLSSLQETKRLITEELRNRLWWWLTTSHPFCIHRPASWFITCILPCFSPLSRRSIK